MTEPSRPLLEVEATGETIGEAKWLALRELEKLRPGLDKSAVVFQVVSEGQRGLLGVGYAPARVVARLPEGVWAETASATEETALGRRVRELVERIVAEIGGPARVDVAEDDETMTVLVAGPDLGRLIGKHGQTVDSIQLLVNAIVQRDEDEAKPIVVDAAGYRERRRATLEALAVRIARRVVETGEAVALEPMSAVERKIVHLRLKAFPGVETRSEGAEPRRYVVIVPASD